MATLTPPGGARGVLTVDDDNVDRYIAAGWRRSDGVDTPAPEPEETVKVTETGGPEADDEDREFVRTVVSDSLGDEDVLATDFGRDGDERVKGSTEPLPAAGDVDTQVVAGEDRDTTKTRSTKTARARGAAKADNTDDES